MTSTVEFSHAAGLHSSYLSYRIS